MDRRFTTLLIPFFIASCASSPNPADSTKAPDKLKPSDKESLVMIVPAKGVQIYECRAVKDQAGKYEWTFVAPEAQLLDKSGNTIGKHYAGPHWEANDGSKIVGTLKERADAPTADAIPWLLLTTKPAGTVTGTFSKITSIQRLNTTGGVTPRKESCQEAIVGTRARIDYTADYYFYAQK